MSAFGTVLTHAAWRSKPSWAVIATEDKAFDQAMLIYMAERVNARIIKVSASHAVFMTQPKVVADTMADRPAMHGPEGSRARLRNRAAGFGARRPHAPAEAGSRPKRCPSPAAAR